MVHKIKPSLSYNVAAELENPKFISNLNAPMAQSKARMGNLDSEPFPHATASISAPEHA